jgi:hypothetical protein
MMTRKDYKLIAAAIKSVPTVGADGVYISKDLLVWKLCNLLEADNPAFDQEKFEKAVNTESSLNDLWETIA